MNFENFGLKMMGEKGTNIRVYCEMFWLKIMGKRGKDRSELLVWAKNKGEKEKILE